MLAFHSRILCLSPSVALWVEVVNRKQRLRTSLFSTSWDTVLYTRVVRTTITRRVPSGMHAVPLYMLPISPSIPRYSFHATNRLIDTLLLQGLMHGLDLILPALDRLEVLDGLHFQLCRVGEQTIFWDVGDMGAYLLWRPRLQL